ncbi:MAG: 4-(cytidine 5'-diphospho)-2-C-methyl-D-erythritol kinase, partial [Spirochaetales bacterium]|nr:4-(cytidine 5'-diphospho)-2-C-methyl-D-erythritol kinase [Spirochaetales bacterium]
MMRIYAPAKLNLHLDVGRLRSDGFHEILSLFIKINMFDRLHISLRESSTFSCRIEGLQHVPLHQNTMYKASEVFSLLSGKSCSVDIMCEKKIPEQAGLGGGSSDAASVLTGLNQLSG